MSWTAVPAPPVVAAAFNEPRQECESTAALSLAPARLEFGQYGHEPRLTLIEIFSGSAGAFERLEDSRPVLDEEGRHAAEGAAAVLEAELAEGLPQQRHALGEGLSGELAPQLLLDLLRQTLEMALGEVLHEHAPKRLSPFLLGERF